MKTGHPVRSGNESGKTLIVGGDGKVGRALALHLSQAGQPTIVTSRRPSTESAVPLDLAEDVSGWPIPEGISVAIVCAAIPLMDLCEKDPQGTARVNVLGTLALIERLVASDVFTVFLSTNQVFDGQTPRVPPDSPQSPRSEYGCQKTRVEQALFGLGDRAAIVRFGKIIEPGTPLFRGWRDALVSGGTITPFVDMWMAPIPLSTTVSILRLIADRQLGGIWQVSGERDVTYADVATRLAAQLKVPPEQVRPIAAKESGRVTSHLARHTTLCVDRLQREFGIQPPPVDWTVQATFESL
ncbi:MAG: sugar nucleotide-binding protein [Planctomycetales bacterium]